MPGLLLVVCISAFGLLIPFLGFHWDDWMTLYLADSQTSFTGYWYSAFRPLHAILDEIFYALFGTTPLPWHLLSLSLRWLTAVLAWRVLLRVWLQRGEFAAWVAVLFAIYPSFFQQASSVIYRHHWASYALFLASLLFMLARPREPGRQNRYLGLGLLTMALGLLITEYMLGLELLRPLLLWKVLEREEPRRAARRRAVRAAWWPYLALGLAFAVWRTFVASSAADPNPPSLLFDLLAAPLTTLLATLEAGLRDLLQLLWSAWTSKLRPDLIAFSDRSVLFAWIVGVMAAGAVWFAMQNYIAGEKEPNADTRNWAQAARLGLAAVVGGLSTSWMIGRHFSEGGFSDRFSIPAMLGASLLMCSLVFAAIRHREQRRLVLSVLVVIAVAAQLRASNQYAIDWERQNRFAWQLAARAPSLDPGTTIVADGAVSTYLTRYNAAFAINLLYARGGQQPTYWYEEFYTGLHNNLGEFGDGLPIQVQELGVEFSGNTNETLVLVTEPGASICMWVLGPQDRHNYTIDADLREIAPYSNLTSISSMAQAADAAALFGSQPDPYWCSYLQQAGLAYQQQDWAEIIRIWDASQAADLDAYDGHEYVPFIEALAREGRVEEAVELSVRAYHRTLQSVPALCAAWERARAQLAAEEYAAARAQFGQTFSCGRG